MNPAVLKKMSAAIHLIYLLLAARWVAADPVAAEAAAAAPAGAGDLPSAAAKGAYLGNAEPTIWKRPAILTLGDSLTELGLDPEGGWTARLGQAYARKADVINRGFGGYNTITTLLSLPEILDSVGRQQVALATVWLGANDASRPDRSNAAAHVPLDQYITGLTDIVQSLRAAGAQQVVLITPPPVNEAAPDAPGGQAAPDRTLMFTQKYAAAARSVAAQLGVPLLDVWQIFLTRANWRDLLRTDGLHMNLEGQKVVYEELMNLIETKVTEARPAALAWHHPTWWFVDYANAKHQWAAEQAAYEAAFGAQT